MATALRFTCHGFTIHSRQQKSGRARVVRFPVLCYSSPPHSTGEDDSQSLKKENEDHLVLLEKYGNGTSKRYIVESDSHVRTVLEERTPEKVVFRESGTLEAAIDLYWLPKVIKDFILPAGFPDSVSDDYLEYMLLQFPTNVTGWICHTLVTSSLLKAVGVGSFSGTTAAASAAAIRWVSKDGIGALGRLFIGGRFGNLFDDDPKQWRLYADFIGSAGSIFDLSTPLYPGYFLPLASLGNLAKAVGRGLRDPSFRVIQNHFAISGNLGEVSAKEEVWEVVAELVGLALGIIALDTPSISSSYPMLAWTWLGLRLLHLWFRYLSLSVLRFNTINLKRARILVNSHIIYQNVPGINECNRMENLLVWERFLKPRIVFGVPLEEMIVGNKRGSMVRILLELYREEEYLLVVNQLQTELKILVSFKEGATSLSVLRSVWQSYWLHENWTRSDNNAITLLEQSLVELDDKFDEFWVQLEQSGWDIDRLNLKVPMEISIEENRGKTLKLKPARISKTNAKNGCNDSRPSISTLHLSFSHLFAGRVRRSPPPSGTLEMTCSSARRRGRLTVPNPNQLILRRSSGESRCQGTWQSSWTGELELDPDEGVQVWSGYEAGVRAPEEDREAVWRLGGINVLTAFAFSSDN
ncbi:Protein root UVB sensitive 5 [Striga hermonthica]|uniref:Protein root UVB sensitive 5 n=1 Tax=Striga hermonthica TaxID=68872 RepID=A0A9N7NJ61_STRHE|nr:Protein root UVB sensitive 5 [Striga hermonthica]